MMRVIGLGEPAEDRSLGLDVAWRSDNPVGVLAAWHKRVRETFRIKRHSILYGGRMVLRMPLLSSRSLARSDKARS